MSDVQIQGTFPILFTLILMGYFCFKYPVVVLSFICNVPYSNRIGIGPYTTLHFAWALLLVCSFVNLVLGKVDLRYVIRRAEIMIPLIACTAWIYINMYMPDLPDISLGSFRFWLFFLKAFLPCFLMVIFTRTESEILLFIYSTIFFAFFTVIIIMTSSIVDPNEILSDGNTRLTLYGVDPITLSIMLGMGVLLSIGVFSGNIKGVLLLSVIFPAILIVVLFTKTRQTLISVLFASFVHVLMSNKRRYGIFLFISILIITFSLLYTWKDTSLGDRFFGTVQDPQEAGWYRIDRYKEAWNDFASSPISGIGTAKFGEYVDIIYLSPSRMIYERDHAHNFLLDLLAEQGIIGLTLYTWFFFVSFRPINHFLSNKIIRVRKTLFALIIFATIQTMFTGGFIQSYHMFWIPVLIFISGDIVQEDYFRRRSMNNPKIKGIRNIFANNAR